MSREALDCNEFVELVTDYLDGAMDRETQARFDSHMVDCDGCCNYEAVPGDRANAGSAPC